MPLLALIKGRRGESGFGFASTAEEVTKGLDLTGKTILITGINSGLGFESGRVLASHGALVIGAARTLEKAKAACETLPGETLPIECELSEPASVRACVQTLVERGEPIDVLLCNAGIMALPKLEQSQGIELQLFTNHFGHFMLVTGLLDLLAEDGRVVMVSSAGHQRAPEGGIEFDNLSGEEGYNGFTAYGQSKLANVLMAKELARRFAGTGRTAFSLHPGGIYTNLGRHLNPLIYLAMPVVRLFMKSVPQGAATQCYVAVHPDAVQHNGAYFADCNVAPTSAYGTDPELARKLWDVSEELVAQL
jgi:WW domain-containing oxidoreductase